MRNQLLRAGRNQRRRRAAGRARIAPNNVTLQPVENPGGVLAVNRDQLIADHKGILRTRQPRPVDVIHQQLSVVDINGKLQTGDKGRRDEVSRVAVVKGRDIFRHHVVKLKICSRAAHLVEPGRQVQNVDAERRAFPVRRTILFGISRAQILEVCQLLIRREPLRPNHVEGQH